MAAVDGDGECSVRGRIGKTTLVTVTGELERE
jgi:hypothetical protein